MRFVVRLGFLLFVLGAMFWGDVLAFLELAEARNAAPVQESTEVVADSAPARQDAREEARLEFERLRRQNLAEAEAEARWRARENAAADREDELERLREAREEREDILEPGAPMQRRPPPPPPPRSGRR
jgi:hypothetical protein